MDAFFYMVYVDGKPGPITKHPFRQEAEAEVERLVRKEGKEAYVLAAIMKGSFAPTPIQWETPYNENLK